MNKSNQEIAQLLFYTSTLLDHHPDKSNQAQAYHDAALEIQKLKKSLYDFKSIEELDMLRHIGKVIARELYDYIKQDHLYYLEKELRQSPPEKILELVEGIGPKKSQQIIDAYAIDSFDTLLREFADHQFDLCIEQDSEIKQNLSRFFNLIPCWYSNKEDEIKYFAQNRPTTTDLINADAIFLKGHPFSDVQFAEKKIQVNNFLFTAHYSDSQNARRKGKLGDWLTLHYKSKGHELKWTILTSEFGKSKGKRIVMGEEKESLKYYENMKN